MAIRLSRYVQITSGVGAGAAVDRRNLMGRFFDTNPLIPTKSFIDFGSLDEVGRYFGTSSAEYARASLYFGWTSKNITRPQTMSFARWADVATAPQIFGAKGSQSVSNWTSITAGSFVLTLGGVTSTISGLNFSGAVTLANVAAIVQAAIRAQGTPATFTGVISTATTPRASFTGVIATSGGIDTLTASSVTGTIAIGDVVTGSGVFAGTTIAAYGTGTGSAGTYILSTSGKTTASTAMTSGSVVTDTLTASSTVGVISIGDTVTGSGVAANTTITAFGTGTGGNGTYILSSHGQTASSTAMSAGDLLPNWSTATVVWNAVRSSFDFTGGATGVANISVAAGSGGSDIAGQLGWLSTLAIFSNGVAAQTVSQVLEQSANDSNNFGSFAFMPTLSTPQIVEAATWNLAQNNMFMYSVRCTADNASALRTALQDIGGVTITLAPIANEYPEQVPMMILAATDYAATNSTQNYEFQMFNLTPSVTTDADANIYDAMGINYYGQTQTAGQKIEFYQQGVMQGLPVDPRDQNTYANEIWLKDAASSAIMTLLLALNKLPANARGRAQLLSVLQGVINAALNNGTISPAKPLTDTQILYITEITGNPTAYRQVQSDGYWVDVQIVPVVVDQVTRYVAKYTLVYSKDDVIRKVEGRDVLI